MLHFKKELLIFEIDTIENCLDLSYSEYNYWENFKF